MSEGCKICNILQSLYERVRHFVFIFNNLRAHLISRELTFAISRKKWTQMVLFATKQEQNNALNQFGCSHFTRVFESLSLLYHITAC